MKPAAELARIRAISLDLDDSLWPIRPAIEEAERALQEWLQRHFPKVSQRFDTHALRVLRSQLCKRYPERMYDVSWLRLRTIETALELCGYNRSHGDTAYRLFYRRRNQVELYADVLPVLQRWRKRFPIVATTNGNACLRSIGIHGLIGEMVKAADLGCAKPAAAMFQQAARVAGIPVRQLLHIGDHPREDVLGAEASGAMAVWLNRDGRPWPLNETRPASAADLFIVDQMLSESQNPLY